MNRGVRQKEDGFTFIELAIAMAVISVALLGLLAANTMMQRASEAAFQRTMAIQHASQIAERMRDLAQTSVSSVTSTFPNGSTVASSNYTSTSSEVLPNESVVVSYVSTAANPLDVTITVNWNEQGIRAVSKTLRTLVTTR